MPVLDRFASHLRKTRAERAKERRETWLAWVSRRDRKASVIFDTRDRVRGVAGATLTWHVRRYQVLPRRRVDADRWRMRGHPHYTPTSPPPICTNPRADLRSSTTPADILVSGSSTLDFLPLSAETGEIEAALSPSRSHPNVCQAPTALPPCPAPARRRSFYRLHQHHQPATNKFASRIGRHSVTTMQPIFHRNYHRPPPGSLHTRRDARNEAGARGSPASCSLFRSLSLFLSLSVCLSVSRSLFFLDVYIRHDAARRCGGLDTDHLHTRPSRTVSVLAVSFSFSFPFFSVSFFFFALATLEFTDLHRDTRTRTSFPFGFRFTG